MGETNIVSHTNTHTRRHCGWLCVSLCVCVCVPARPHALDNHKASELPPSLGPMQRNPNLAADLLDKRCVRLKQLSAELPPHPLSTTTPPPPASSLPALRDVNGMLSHHSVNFGVVESGVEALHSCVARCHLQQYGGWGGGLWS